MIARAALILAVAFAASSGAAQACGQLSRAQLAQSNRHWQQTLDRARTVRGVYRIDRTAPGSSDDAQDQIGRITAPNGKLRANVIVRDANMIIMCSRARLPAANEQGLFYLQRGQDGRSDVIHFVADGEKDD